VFTTSSRAPRARASSTAWLRAERELGSSRTTSNTLRAQPHEFANQLHTISGLLHLEEYDEVTSRIDDATVAALLIAKASLASERGVELRLQPESRLR
jgi:two-component system CitB family sensor kinase